MNKCISMKITSHFLFVFLCFISASQVYGAVFDYSRDKNFVVIEYSQSHDMIAEVDPVPMLRIYGDGRVHVHFPVYMKRAGDYEMRLSDAQLQTLLGSMESKGILKFDQNKVRQLKILSEKRIQAASPGGVVTILSDDTRSRFQVNLGTYISSGTFTPQNNFAQAIEWKNLKWDAQKHKDISELGHAADAEQELSGFLNHADLVKIK